MPFFFIRTDPKACSFFSLGVCSRADLQVCMRNNSCFEVPKELEGFKHGFPVFETQAHRILKFQHIYFHFFYWSQDHNPGLV